MEEPDPRHVAEGLWRALQAGDWEAAGGYLHDDFVQEWPQSGERIVGRDLGVSVIELRDGKVVKETDYYAQPFQAPAWRAQWVERT